MTHLSAEGLDACQHCQHVLPLIQVHCLEEVCLSYSVLLTGTEEVADVLHLYEGHALLLELTGTGPHHSLCQPGGEKRGVGELTGQ